MSDEQEDSGSLEEGAWIQETNLHTIAISKVKRGQIWIVAGRNNGD